MIGFEDSANRLIKESIEESSIGSIVHTVSISESVDEYPVSVLTLEQKHIVGINVQGSKTLKTLFGSKESSQDSKYKSNKQG